MRKELHQHLADFLFSFPTADWTMYSQVSDLYEKEFSFPFNGITKVGILLSSLKLRYLFHKQTQILYFLLVHETKKNAKPLEIIYQNFSKNIGLGQVFFDFLKTNYRHTL